MGQALASPAKKDSYSFRPQKRQIGEADKDQTDVQVYIMCNLTSIAAVRVPLMLAEERT
jgi:hypothetical protein